MSEKFRIFATVIRLLAEFSEDEENKKTRIQEYKNTRKQDDRYEDD